MGVKAMKRKGIVVAGPEHYPTIKNGGKKDQRGVPAQVRKLGGVQCGAKTRSGRTCIMPAGWGTQHPGIGKCRRHGGNLPNHVKSAAKEEHRRLLGSPKEINPLDALLWCIKIRAGEVQWLGDRMADLDQQDWTQNTIAGKQFHLYVKERQAAMQDLARFSQMAISLGIAERAVKLAETYGEMIARLIQGILVDLNLSEEQRAEAPKIVRKHLIAIEGGSEVLDGKATEVAC